MHISVTAMATDSAATALSVATIFTVVCISLSHWCAHHCHTNVNIAVTALSVDTAQTAVTLPGGVLWGKRDRDDRRKS